MNPDIKLFYPYMDANIQKRVLDTLNTRWLGQGPQVDEFEERFKEMFDVRYPVMVNSCTSALELAYEILGINEHSIVYVPVLTCTATNIPLLRRKATIRFMDIDPYTLNPVIPEGVRPSHSKIKDGFGTFIVSVDLNGIKNEVTADVHDTAQGVGITHDDGITCYSFQAIKQFTTGDGGLMAMPNLEGFQLAKLLRWFGIDREEKRRADFQYYKGRQMMGDMKLPGFKFQPTDIAASMGLGGLDAFEAIMAHRKELFTAYEKELSGIDGLRIIDGLENKYYTLGVVVDNRHEFSTKLKENGIENNMVQLRNDIYTVFGGDRQDLPNMNALEDKYLFLPLNTHMRVEDVEYIGKVVRSGW